MNLMNKILKKEVKISDIPDGKIIDDYPDDTIFIWTEDEDDDWEPKNKTSKE